MSASVRRRACPHGDRLCPCQDGDGALCVYEGDTRRRCSRALPKLRLRLRPSNNAANSVPPSPLAYFQERVYECNCASCPQCGYPVDQPDRYRRCEKCRADNRARRAMKRKAKAKARRSAG